MIRFARFSGIQCAATGLGFNIWSLSELAASVSEYTRKRANRVVLLSIACTGYFQVY